MVRSAGEVRGTSIMDSFEWMGSIQMLAHPGQRQVVAAAVRGLREMVRRFLGGAGQQLRNDQLP